MNLQMKTTLALAEIMKLYTDEADQRPWGIAWSGGKDSTTVLEFVCRAVSALPVEKRTRKIHVVMSDTMMENPELEMYMHNQVDLVTTWAIANKVPLDVTVVHRNDARSFFYLLIGKGYPLPNQSNRWCTHSLKIEPQNAFFKEKGLLNLLLLGTRSDESARRSASIEKYREEADSRFSTHFNNPEQRVYMPIVHFTTPEVWDILQQPLRWGSSEDIRRLYREATGECAVTNPNGATELPNACGARFGCWTCPPITKDKSTENMAIIHEWMKPLVSWRKKLIGTYKEKSNKSGHMRNGRYLGKGQGCLKIEARKELFQSLMKTQETVNDLRSDIGLQPLSLISDTEITMITNQWEIDLRDSPFLNG